MRPRLGDGGRKSGGAVASARAVGVPPPRRVAYGAPGGVIPARWCSTDARFSVGARSFSSPAGASAAIRASRTGKGSDVSRPVFRAAGPGDVFVGCAVDGARA